MAIVTENGAHSGEQNGSTMPPPADLPKAQIYVDNLPTNMTEDGFAELFAPFGELASCKFLKHRTGGETGYGFVSFHDPQASRDAINGVNGTMVYGHKIRVTDAKPESQLLSETNLYICGLPLTMTNSELKSLFEQFGEIDEARVLTSTNASDAKGVGFVHFSEPAAAQQAVTTMNGTQPENVDGPLAVKFARDINRQRRMRGQPLVQRGGRGMANLCRYFQAGRCNRGSECKFIHMVPSRQSGQSGGGWSNGGQGAQGGGGGGWQGGVWQGGVAPSGAWSDFPPPPGLGPDGADRDARGGSGTSTTNLYVSRFPTFWGVDDLENLFSKFGQIDKTRILTDPNAGECRGVGFVHFKDAESAKKALDETNNATPKDCSHEITVKFANQGSKGPRPGPAGLCRFWMKGECTRGDACSFRHDGIGAMTDPAAMRGTNYPVFGRWYLLNTNRFQAQDTYSLDFGMSPTFPYGQDPSQTPLLGPQYGDLSRSLQTPYMGGGPSGHEDLSAISLIDSVYDGHDGTGMVAPSPDYAAHQNMGNHLMAQTEHATYGYDMGHLTHDMGNMAVPSNDLAAQQAFNAHAYHGHSDQSQLSFEHSQLSYDPPHLAYDPSQLSMVDHQSQLAMVDHQSQLSMVDHQSQLSVSEVDSAYDSEPAHAPHHMGKHAAGHQDNVMSHMVSSLFVSH
eukprot:789181_1